MTSREITKQLKGKTVKEVKLFPFSDGKGGYAYSPMIIFTDGTYITFTTQETESLEYGTEINIGNN